MKRVVSVAIGLLALAPVADAATTPKPGTGDPRIQTVEYDAQQVVDLRVPMGFALTLEFATDERIENVALGNAGVWQVTLNKSADHLFIKPQQGASDTDMTVVTDARTYAFELKAAPDADPSAPILVRLVYPAPAAVADPSARTDHYAYSFSGSRTLRPSDMSDDGRFTSILWAAKSPIPAVFIIDDEGREALVNGGVREGRFVVDQIGKEFIFRLGTEEAHATRHIVKAKRR